MEAMIFGILCSNFPSVSDAWEEIFACLWVVLRGEAIAETLKI